MAELQSRSSAPPESLPSVPSLQPVGDGDDAGPSEEMDPAVLRGLLGPAVDDDFDPSSFERDSYRLCMLSKSFTPPDKFAPFCGFCSCLKRCKMPFVFHLADNLEFYYQRNVDPIQKLSFVVLAVIIFCAPPIGDIMLQILIAKKDPQLFHIIDATSLPIYAIAAFVGYIVVRCVPWLRKWIARIPVLETFLICVHCFVVTVSIGHRRYMDIVGVNVLLGTLICVGFPGLSIVSAVMIGMTYSFLAGFIADFFFTDMGSYLEAFGRHPHGYDPDMLRRVWAMKNALDLVISAAVLFVLGLTLRYTYRRLFMAKSFLRHRLNGVRAEEERNSLILKNILPRKVVSDALSKRGPMRKCTVEKVAVAFIQIASFGVRVKSDEFLSGGAAVGTNRPSSPTQTPRPAISDAKFRGIGGVTVTRDQNVKDMSAIRTVALLDAVITDLDRRVAKEKWFYRVKTVGNTYFLTAGLFEESRSRKIGLFQRLLDFILKIIAERPCGCDFRAGLSVGQVTWGIIGTAKDPTAFDVYGSTVNLASRLSVCARNGTCQVPESNRVDIVDIENYTFAVVMCSLKGRGACKVCAFTSKIKRSGNRRLLQEKHRARQKVRRKKQKERRRKRRERRRVKKEKAREAKRSQARRSQTVESSDMSDQTGSDGSHGPPHWEDDDRYVSGFFEAVLDGDGQLETPCSEEQEEYRRYRKIYSRKFGKYGRREATSDSDSHRRHGGKSPYSDSELDDSDDSAFTASADSDSDLSSGFSGYTSGSSLSSTFSSLTGSSLSSRYSPWAKTAKDDKPEDIEDINSVNPVLDRILRRGEFAVSPEAAGWDAYFEHHRKSLTNPKLEERLLLQLRDPELKRRGDEWVARWISHERGYCNPRGCCPQMWRPTSKSKFCGCCGMVCNSITLPCCHASVSDFNASLQVRRYAVSNAFLAFLVVASFLFRCYDDYSFIFFGIFQTTWWEVFIRQITGFILLLAAATTLLLPCYRKTARWFQVITVFFVVVAFAVAIVQIGFVIAVHEHPRKEVWYRESFYLFFRIVLCTVALLGGVPFYLKLIICIIAIALFWATIIGVSIARSIPTAVVLLVDIDTSMTFALVIAMSLAFELFDLMLFRAMLREKEVREDLRQQTERGQLLLDRFLPSIVLDMVNARHGCGVVADFHREVGMLYADMVNFTQWALDKQDSHVLMNRLDRMFTAFESYRAALGLFRVKIVGDCFHVLSNMGNPLDPSTKKAFVEPHLVRLLEFGFHVLEFLKTIPRAQTEPVKFRIGAHYGSCVLGVLGTLTRFSFDVFGFDDYITEQLEECGLPGFIQVSRRFSNAMRPFQDTYPVTFRSREDHSNDDSDDPDNPVRGECKGSRLINEDFDGGLSVLIVEPPPKLIWELIKEERIVGERPKDGLVRRPVDRILKWRSLSISSFSSFDALEEDDLRVTVDVDVNDESDEEEGEVEFVIEEVEEEVEEEGEVVDG